MTDAATDKLSAARHPSRLELAIWLAGDASQAQDAQLAKHVDSCHSCSAALEELRAHQLDYERRAPAELARLRAGVEGIAGAGDGWHRFVVGFATVRLAASLCALAIVGVVVVLAVSRLARPPASDGARAVVAGSVASNSTPSGAWSAAPSSARGNLRGKGAALGLRVVVRRGAHRFELADAAGSSSTTRLREGDALRFVVTVPRGGYLAVFSIDGRRQVTSFYPPQRSAPARRRDPLRLRRAGRHVLPGSVVLDDAPGREHVVVAFAARPFDRAALQRRVSQRVLAGRDVSAGDVGVDAITTVVFERERRR